MPFKAPYMPATCPYTWAGAGGNGSSNGSGQEENTHG